jgi:prepilin-type processing-associated H-X9-DG protein
MTLVELLSVISIIAVMAAILFPVFARAREGARKHSCLGNLVNISLALHLYAEDHAGLLPPTDDDLSPLFGRYVRDERVFMCPSSDPYSIPMGAPANPDLLPPPRTGARPGTAGASGTGTGSGETAEKPEERTQPPLTTNYYYRAGHRPNESPSVPVITDQAPHHNERANVMYSDGHAKTLPEQVWRELGFTPLEELLEPPPAEGDAGTGAPGMGAPGAPGGGG